jgi:tRNA G46 methylase TrmB
MELSTATGWWDLLPFPTHRVQIAEDPWTANTGVIAADDLRNRLVLDYYGGNLNEYTVVDLGSLEGGFAAELARRGAARNIGVEVHKTSFDRCELVRKLLGLKNPEYVLADLRDVLPK